jgi:hypothetical protein
VALNNLGSGYVPDTAVIMAGTLIGTLPVLVVFVSAGTPDRQRHHGRGGQGLRDEISTSAGTRSERTN